tara:strand:- start:377 stop:751 length:375 start_codon:yes stop_codon:yes gene_type:complete
MPKIRLTLYPGKELKEVIKNHQSEGKKYPIAASLFFEDNEEKSGFTFFDDVTFKADTKVGLTAWANLNKNQKEVLTIEIEDFNTWNSKQKELAAKKPKPVSNNIGASNTSFDTDGNVDDLDFLK